MFKKAVLFVATFAVISLLYGIYQWREDPVLDMPTAPRREPLREEQAASPEGRSYDSQVEEGESAISFRGVRLPPGESPRLHIFNEDGSERLLFHAAKWNPAPGKDTEFELVEPWAKMVLPAGQAVYVWSDEGRMEVQRSSDGDLTPQKGELRGHVRIVIDRTTPEWRRANPGRAEPEQHPQECVRIWLDDLHFDLDMAELSSQSPLALESAFGRITGKGLELFWNEVTRQVTRLRIAEGDRAVIRGGALGGFDLASAEVVQAPAASGPAEVDAASAAPAGQEAPPADSIANVGTEELPSESADGTESEEPQALTFLELDDEEADAASQRIDTYRVTFRDDVDVRQKQGLRTLGSLEAALLELTMDLGPQERSSLAHPAAHRRDAGATPAGDADRTAEQKGDDEGPKAVVEVRWSGELLVEPAPAPATQPGAVEAAESQKRLHVVAKGSPVRLREPSRGDVTCAELEYHDETQKVRLFGSPETPVVMTIDKGRELSARALPPEEWVVVDRLAGTAVVQGPGRMIDANASAGPPALALAAEGTGPGGGAAPSADGIRWTDSLTIGFGSRVREVPGPPGKPPIQRREEYLTSAVFNGGVHVDRPGQTIETDHVEVTFMEPAADAPPGGDPAANLAAKRILAIGSVRMRSDSNHIACDRLDADMVVDDAGNNVPALARAYGNVVAVQGRSEIRAADRLLVAMASVPKTLTDAERAHYEAAAKKQGIEPGTPQWQAAEEKIRRRREIVITSLKGFGDVRVLSPQDELDLAAETLDCRFGDDRQISQATIVAADGAIARVQADDFYVEGPRVVLDMAEQMVEVPGAGRMRFHARQDLDGRAVDEPLPIEVTWDKRMSLRGKANTGAFVGSASARSRDTVMSSNELRIDFADLPKLPEKPAVTQPADASDRRWIAGPVIEQIAGRDEPPTMARASRQMRKRPAYLHAVGEAAIESSTYDRTPGGAIQRLLTAVVPGQRQRNASADGAPLVSRITLSGPRIGVDLIQEHLSVEGAGTLLIEDYRLPETRGASPASPLAWSDPADSALEAGGPSHTLFKWENSMVFLNDRNLAVFDHRVGMWHQAGVNMALSASEARALGLDPAKLAEAGGRDASLTCDNLLVEFVRDDAVRRTETTPLSRARRLEAFWARGLGVRMESGNRTAQGTVFRYDRSTGILQITGSAQVPPQINEADERTGVRFWRGDSLAWDQRAGTITATGTSMLATRR